MFTLDDIDTVHERYGKQDSTAEYLKALKKVGVDHYDSFITDGHSEYYSEDGKKLVGPPEHEKIPVSDTSDEVSFKKHLALHGNGKTSYFEMSKRLAECGIEKWKFDTVKMTITYFDKQGQAVLIEPVE